MPTAAELGRAYYCPEGVFSYRDISELAERAAIDIASQLRNSEGKLKLSRVGLHLPTGAQFAIAQTSDIGAVRIILATVKVSQGIVPENWSWIQEKWYNISTDEFEDNVRLCNAVRFDVPVERVS
jgi:hypothetical protein